MFEALTSARSFNLLKAGLDCAATRHKIIANNIANVNTPGYKRQFVSFEEQLAAAVDRNEDCTGEPTSDEECEQKAGPVVQTDRRHVMRNDGNNIDIDAEMADLAKNSISYQVYGTRIGAFFDSLNDVITRGGRV